MKKLILIVALLVTPACCPPTRNTETGVSVTSYTEALTKIRDNVAAIRTDVAAIDYNKDLKEADLQLIDATITLCNDTLAGKNAGAAPAPAPAEGGK